MWRSKSKKREVNAPRKCVAVDIVVAHEPDILETVYKVEGWLEDPRGLAQYGRHTFGYIKRGWYPSKLYEGHLSIADFDEVMPRNPSYRGEEMPWAGEVFKNGELLLVAGFPGYEDKGLKDGKQCVHAMFETRYSESKYRWWPLIHRDDSKEVA